MTTDHFQQIADLLPGGAVLLSDKGVVLAASPAVKLAWGLDPQAILGRPLSSLLSSSADEIATFLQVCLESDKPVPHQATLAASSKLLSCRGRALKRSSAAEAPEIVLAGESVDAARVPQQVAAEEIDMRDRLLALLVHDFRNGLASVPMGFDVLEMESGKSETVALLRRQIDQLVHLVDEVLDISRLLRGKVVLRTERVVLQEILQEASAHVAVTLRKRNLELKLSLPPEPVSIPVDPQRMLQIISELVLQRSKNMTAGGQINLSLSGDSKEALIRMRDTGQSINQKLLPHAFDLLAQLRFAGQENRTQLEMGLAVAGALVALHGGRIHAQPLPTPPGMETFIHLPLPAQV